MDGINEIQARIMRELQHHIGRNKAIGMGELYQIAFPGRTWANRINDTRWLRHHIAELRRHGWPILYSTKTDSPGYYLAQTDSETEDQIRRLKVAGLKKLAQAAKLAKTSLKIYVNQLMLNFGEEDAA